MELTYVGPDSMGPHYFESGKRPDPAIQNPAKVIMQLANGSVVFGGYSSPGNFAGKPYGEEFWVIPVIDSSEIVTPVCWWHLPAAAPMTEREWWMAQDWETDHEWQTESFRGYIYEPDGALRHKSDFGWIGDFNELEEAKSAAYNHWVAAGRP